MFNGFRLGIGPFKLIKRTVKETLAESGLAPQGQAKGGITYAAVAMQGMVGAGLTHSVHAPNAP